MTGTQKWGGGNVGTVPNGNVSATGWGAGAATSAKGGKEARESVTEIDFDKQGATVFEVGEDENEDDDDDDDDDEKQNQQEDVDMHDPWAQGKKGMGNSSEFYSSLSFHATLTNTMFKQYLHHYHYHAVPSPPLGL